MVSVCVHCFKESSRIRHPPANNKSSKSGPPWWRKDKEIESLISKICTSKLPSNERGTDVERNPSKDTGLDASANMSSSLIPGLFDEGDDEEEDYHNEVGEDRSGHNNDEAFQINNGTSILERRSTFMGDDI